VAAPITAGAGHGSGDLHDAVDAVSISLASDHRSTNRILSHIIDA